MIHIVRLGTPRAVAEGLRLGTVRRPPRGVAKTDIARRNFYDVWLPELAPSQGLVRLAQTAATSAEWRRFRERYRGEMAKPPGSRILDLLAALSHTANLSVGCYCEDETHCHRSVLRDLLAAHGATLR
ncbi:MAG: DUF488 domain-containing protein [Gemmatimonadales bacterium]